MWLYSIVIAPIFANFGLRIESLNFKLPPTITRLLPDYSPCGPSPVIITVLFRTGWQNIRLYRLHSLAFPPKAIEFRWSKWSPSRLSREKKAKPKNWARETWTKAIVKVLMSSFVFIVSLNAYKRMIGYFGISHAVHDMHKLKFGKVHTASI